MDLPADIKFLIKRNVWIAGALFAAGIAFFEIADSNQFVNLIHRFLSAFSFNFIENSLKIAGLISIGFSVYTFVIWIKAYNKKRLAQRKNAFQQIAESMKWNYSEYLTGNLRKTVESLTANRALGFARRLQITGQSTANFLSKEINGDLLIIFDCVISASAGDDGATTFETVYSVVSDKLNLPYFQTQPETWLGDNALANHFKQKAGINDLNFPQHPIFSQKYIVDTNPTNAPFIFTPQVLDFYEQNQLPHLIGENKTLALFLHQEHPPTQNQINLQLHTLQKIFQLLRKM